jgi:hypothetical protein
VRPSCLAVVNKPAKRPLAASQIWHQEGERRNGCVCIPGWPSTDLTSKRHWSVSKDVMSSQPIAIQLWGPKHIQGNCLLGFGGCGESGRAGVGPGRRQVKFPGLGKSRRPAAVQPSYRVGRLSQLNANWRHVLRHVILPCHDTLFANNA